MHSLHLLPPEAPCRGLTGMAFHFTENRGNLEVPSVLISEGIVAPLSHEVQARQTQRVCSIAIHLCDFFPTVVTELRYIVHGYS